MTVALVIPAAGVGERFSKEIKKQFYLIDGKPVLYFTLKKMLSLYKFDEVILGINDGDKELVHGIISLLHAYVPFKTASGGDTRARTVMNCLEAASSELVLVHDAVRPFVDERTVADVIAKAWEFDGAIPAVKIRDTVKRAENGIIAETVDREGLYLAHTPQGFKRNILKEAMNAAFNGGFSVTDEASAMELFGKSVYIVPSAPDNIKITYTEDIQTVNMLKSKYFG